VLDSLACAINALGAPPLEACRAQVDEFSGPGLHILRTTVAAIAAQEIASLVGLPAPYWATMTALAVMQSTLAASWSVSWKRLLGTAVGAIVGGGLAMLLPPCTLTFAVALVATGLLCAFTGLDRVSYRLAGVTLAVVMLAAGSRPASIIAIHRFAEVSIGIVVTLVISAVWPERAATPLDPQPTTSTADAPSARTWPASVQSQLSQPVAAARLNALCPRRSAAPSIPRDARSLYRVVRERAGRLLHHAA
jgi:hypothetical protein